MAEESEEGKGVCMSDQVEKLIVSENLDDDIELEGDIGVIAAKLLELEKFYQGQGYTDIKLEKQFPKADAIHYSVFGDRLETDRECHARLRETKRKSELEAMKEGDRQCLDAMLLDLLRQRLDVGR
jgi:hypothetical protein